MVSTNLNGRENITFLASFYTPTNAVKLHKISIYRESGWFWPSMSPINYNNLVWNIHARFDINSRVYTYDDGNTLSMCLWTNLTAFSYFIRSSRVQHSILRTNTWSDANGEIVWINLKWWDLVLRMWCRFQR